MTAADLLPLDRVLWQRIEVDDDGRRSALVAGTRRRRPATVRVDARTASTLAQAGIPTITRRAGTAS